MEAADEGNSEERSLLYSGEKRVGRRTGRKERRSRRKERAGFAQRKPCVTRDFYRS